MDIPETLYFLFVCGKTFHGTRCEWYHPWRHKMLGFCYFVPTFCAAERQGKKGDLDSFICFWTGNVPAFMWNCCYINCVGGRLSTPWPLISRALHSCVSLGMPPLECSDKELSTRTAVRLHASHSVLSLFSSPWLLFQFLLDSLLASRTEVLDRQCTRKEKVEDSQLAKASLSSPAAHFPHWCTTLPSCCWCTQATVLGHAIQWESHLRGFTLPSFPSPFRFHPASKKKSAVSSAVLRAWENTEKQIRELVWL